MRIQHHYGQETWTYLNSVPLIPNEVECRSPCKGPNNLHFERVPMALESEKDWSTDSGQVTPTTVPISDDEGRGHSTTSRRVRLGSSSPESGQPEEQSSGDETENEPGDSNSLSNQP